MKKTLILAHLFIFTLISFAQKKNELEYDPNSPASVIMLHSFLSNMSFSSDNGGATIQYIGFNALFLPNKDKKGKDVNYEANSVKDARIFMTVTKDGKPFFKKYGLSAEGNEVQKFCSYAVNTRDLFKDPSPPYTEGSYLLEFFLDDKKFYEFPFTISKQLIKDVYSDKKEMYFLHGFWDEWAWLEPAENGGMYWHFYVQTENVETKKDIDNSADVFGKVDLVKDDKVIAIGMLRYTNPMRIFREWREMNIPLVAKDEKKSLNIKDLSDGKYEMKMELNETKLVYPFEIKGGKIQLDSRQDRTKNTNPYTLLEAKETKFFIKTTSGNTTTIPVLSKK